MEDEPTRDDVTAQSFAIAKLSFLRSSAAEHKDIAFRIMGWYTTILGAIAYAVLFQGISLPSLVLIPGSVVFTALFVHWVQVHRNQSARLIEQASKIEDALVAPASEGEHKLRSIMLASPLEARWWDNERFPPTAVAVLILLLLVYLTWPAQNSSQARNDNGTTGGSQPPNEVQSDDLRKEIRYLREQQQTLIEQHRAWNERQQKSPPALAEAGFSVVQTTVGNTIWVGGAIAIVLIAGGIFLRARGAKLAGSLALLAGASFGGITIFKDVKIQDVVKTGAPIFEWSRPAASNIYIDKIALENNVSDLLIKVLSQMPMPAGSHLNAKRIGGVSQFPIGKAQIETALKKDLEGICPQSEDEVRLYLVVGSTDRLPLSGAIQRQYDANVGLAMARAIAVSKYMTETCKGKISENDILPLVVGPQQTGAPYDPAGAPDDRKVDVYALSSSAIVNLQQARSTRDAGSSPRSLEPIAQQSGPLR